jgi:hypothetical protein
MPGLARASTMVSSCWGWEFVEDAIDMGHERFWAQRQLAWVIRCIVEALSDQFETLTAAGVFGKRRPSGSVGPVNYERSDLAR